MAAYPKKGFETTARIELLMQVQHGVCGICREAIPTMRKRRERQFNPLRATLDHVVPQARDGADEFGNLVVAHARCNNAKANRPPTNEELEFLELVNARIPHLIRQAA